MKRGAGSGEQGVGRQKKLGGVDEIKRSFFGNELSAEQDAECIVRNSQLFSQRLPAPCPLLPALCSEPLIVHKVRREKNLPGRHAEVFQVFAISFADGQKPIELTEQPRL